MELKPEPNDMLQIVEAQRNQAMNECVRLAALLSAADRRIKELEAAAPPAPTPLQAVA